jgi:carbon-monoxide dehydrogenase large subunit
MTSQGQGQATAYAQICAETLGVDVEDVTVRMGDTQMLPFGRGAFASRGAVVGGNAVAGAAAGLRQKALELAGVLLQCDPATLTIAGGRVCREGGEATTLRLGDIAQATMPGAPLYAGNPALEQHFVFDTKQTLTFALSVHAAKVAVDPRSGFYRVLDYYIVHDAGRHINPMIVDGQIVGGAVDGLGGAMFSELLYDDQAQLLTGTLADYLVVTAPEAPRIRVEHAKTLPTTNPLGVRGVGEGGTIPAPAALVNAVSRAIDPAGTGHEESLFSLPLRPEHVLAACRFASAGSAAGRPTRTRD